MTEAFVLSIEGMHCGACVRRVTSALEKVAEVEVSLVEIGTARGTFDPKRVAVEEIIGAVRRIGFTVRGEV